MTRYVNYDFAAHKLMDQLKAQDIFYHHGYTISQQQKIWAACPILGEGINNAVKFNIGDLSKTTWININDLISKDVMPPFELCYFEWKSNFFNLKENKFEYNKYQSVLLTPRKEKETYGCLFFREEIGMKGLFYLEPIGIEVVLTEEYPHYRMYPTIDNLPAGLDLSDNENKLHEMIHAYMVPILNFIGLLNTKNANSVKIDAPIKLNKKRTKSGKLPLFSYHVLKLDLGGTNATRNLTTVSDQRNPPRLHYRRGHTRILETGKRVWVKSCIVGDEDIGICKKDYSI